MFNGYKIIFEKSIGQRCVSLYIDSVPVFYVSALFQYHNEYFTVGLEIGKGKSFTLFFFFKFVLFVLISLLFHVNIRISFFISIKTKQTKNKKSWWDFG